MLNEHGIYQHWFERARENYEAHRGAWITAGATVLAVVIGVSIYLPQSRRQEAAVQKLFTEGFQSMIAGNFSRAASTFEKAGSTGYRWTSLNDEASIYEATALFGLGRFDRSEELWSKYLERNSKGPHAAAALAGRASAHEARFEWEKAAALYREALEKHPESYLVSYIEYRLAAMLRRTGAEAEALAIYEKLKKREEEDIWFEFGRSRARIAPATASAAPSTDASSATVPSATAPSAAVPPASASPN